jgi:hypothetical protein
MTVQVYNAAETILHATISSTIVRSSSVHALLHHHQLTTNNIGTIGTLKYLACSLETKGS